MIVGSHDLHRGKSDGHQRKQRNKRHVVVTEVARVVTMNGEVCQSKEVHAIDLVESNEARLSIFKAVVDVAVGEAMQQVKTGSSARNAR